MAEQEAGSRSNMDPQITINDVVNNVKSEGIFDQDQVPPQIQARVTTKQ